MLEPLTLTFRQSRRTLTLDTKADPAMTRRLERYYDDTYGIPTRWFQVPEHALGLADPFKVVPWQR